MTFLHQQGIEEPIVIACFPQPVAKLVDSGGWTLLGQLFFEFIEVGGIHDVAFLTSPTAKLANNGIVAPLRTPGERLRQVRAVKALECMGTSIALDMLRNL